MARYKAYDSSQDAMVPISFEKQLVPGSFEFAINELVNRNMNLSIFDAKYKNDETGCPAYDPKILLKIVLLAYSRGITGSRKIEQACRENVTFMALSCWTTPDHSTIASFVTSMKEEVSSLFRDILLVCEEENLLGGTHFSLDGLKLSSNASKESSGIFSDLKIKQEKLEKKIKELVESHESTDKKGEDKNTNSQKRENQIKRLEKQSKRIEKFLKENKPRLGQRNKEIQSNITDNESAKMKTSHGTIQGYNGQALVDSKHQIIVHSEVFGNGQDFGNLTPMVDGAKENVKSIGLPNDYFEDKQFSADSNYHSNENLKKCEEEKLNAFIPDTHFRKRDPRFATQERHKPEKEEKFTQKDFSYNQEEDHYTCPNNSVLKLRARRHKLNNKFFRGYEAKEADCKECSLREKCLHNKNSRSKNLLFYIEDAEETLSQKMIAKIDTKEAREIYSRRLGIVEPVFGNIRIQKRLDRFTLRGKQKVNIQWMLYCMVHNIEKINNYARTA